MRSLVGRFAACGGECRPRWRGYVGQGRRLGFALFEVMVSAALLFGFLAILVSVALPLGRYSARDSARARLDQQAMVSLAHLDADLRTSQPGGVHCLPATPGTPAVLAIQPLDGLTVDGFEAWRAGLVLYTWNRETGVLARRVVPPWPGPAPVTVSRSGPAALTEGELRALAALASSGGTALAQGVVDLAWTHAGSEATVVGPLKVRMQARVGVEGTHDSLEQTWERSFRFPAAR